LCRLKGIIGDAQRRLMASASLATAPRTARRHVSPVQPVKSARLLQLLKLGYEATDFKFCYQF
jgi:hypothetical protein